MSGCWDIWKGNRKSTPMLALNAKIPSLPSSTCSLSPHQKCPASPFISSCYEAQGREGHELSTSDSTLLAISPHIPSCITVKWISTRAKLFSLCWELWKTQIALSLSFLHFETYITWIMLRPHLFPLSIWEQRSHGISSSSFTCLTLSCSRPKQGMEVMWRKQSPDPSLAFSLLSLHILASLSLSLSARVLS